MEFKIKPDDKILLIAHNPDDTAIACGGLVCRYSSQIDVLCVNLNEIEYEGQKFSAATSENLTYNTFNKIFDKLNITNFYITSSTENGKINTLESLTEECLSHFNIKDYDIILAPQKDEKNQEYRFIGNILVKNLLEKQGYKPNLKLLRYELWNPIKDANFYEDITSVTEKKKELILSYKTADINNIINMNKFRTFTSYLAGSAEYVEAYLIDDLNAFLQSPDIINADTEREFFNKDLELYFSNKNAQDIINNLANELSHKRVVIWGADEYTRYIFKKYDLSNLNITAISDKRFEQKRVHEFYGLNCIEPSELKNVDCDVILISDRDFVSSYNSLIRILSDSENETLDIYPLLKKEIADCENKVCARPFHTASIFPSGHCITCCPAYINNYAIGNVLRQSFKNVWNSVNAKNLRKLLLRGDYSFCDLNTCIQMEPTDKNELAKYFIDENKTVNMPDTIYMGWDYDCNVACITCRNNLIKNDESSLNALQAIESPVLEACKTAKLFYTSGNGDPFGSTYARNLIKKVAEINPEIKFYIHTNGILCTEKMCEELKIKDRIQNVIFSIHASCKETYDKIVRYGNFDKVMENLEWISKLKQSRQIKTFIMAFVVHKLNYKDMPDFVRLAEKFDAKASFRYYRQWANNTEYKYEDMAVFEKQHEEYTQLVSILQDKIFDSPNCSLDPSIIAIRENGQIK